MRGLFAALALVAAAAQLLTFGAGYSIGYRDADADYRQGYMTGYERAYADVRSGGH